MEGWRISNSVRVVGAVVLALIGWLYFRFDPAQYPFPKCPFLFITGYQCPGCGSQRALHRLLHGDVIAAAQSNPLFMLALPYVLFGLVLEYTSWGRRQLATRRRWYGYRATQVVLVVVVVFWVTRIARMW